jgi:hypothetical protein
MLRDRELTWQVSFDYVNGYDYSSPRVDIVVSRRRRETGLRYCGKRGYLNPVLCERAYAFFWNTAFAIVSTIDS